MNRQLPQFVLACLTASAAAFAPAPVSKAPEEITNSIGMKLVRIPAGEFMMGSSKEERSTVLKELRLEVMPRDLKAESPRRKVKITTAFHMGVYEVTQDEYEKVMGKHTNSFSSVGNGKGKVKGLHTSRFPVDSVSHDDAVEFCEKLSAKAAEKGRFYRLPTEAQWEYACRAGTNTATHFGRNLSSRQANFQGDYPHGGAEKGDWLRRTCEVGSFKPNGFGLYDMCGNVREWCSDRYGEDYYFKGDNADPKGPESGDFRVLRGGSWHDNGWTCRSANRIWNSPSTTDAEIGFRVVCGSLPEVSSKPAIDSSRTGDGRRGKLGQPPPQR